ncbi:MAG: PTS sugar transporter subunit IIA [Traorella sp.]
MIGILLISHGKMAEGMKDSLTMFFGDNIQQLDTLSLRMDSSADAFGQELHQKIEQLDSGDGVIIFADLLGGTPCNQALLCVNEKVDLIVGMNLPTLMEVLALRECGTVHISELIEKGKASILDAKVLLYQDSSEEDDD